MNRKTFIRNMTFSSGIVLGMPLIAAGKVNKQTDLKSGLPLRNTPDSGNKPFIYETPWGQKILIDRYTYSDMHRAKWRLEGLSYSDIELKIKGLDEALDKGEISFRGRPCPIVNGLWLIETDGQQNIYILKSEQGLILVDPGMESNTRMIEAQLKMLGYSIKDVRYVLLTHCHVDHAHSAAFWQKKGAEILIHEAGRNPIQTGNEITAWWLNDSESDRFFPPVKEVTSFHDGDCLQIGEHRIFVCHTPGHTPDSSCFFLRLDGKNVLIAGDTLFHNGKHGWMGHPYADYESYLSSLWKLKRFAVEGYKHNEPDRIMVRDAIQFDILCPGHTAISMDNVSRDIDKAIEIMSYTIRQRRKGKDYQWTEPYTFFAERELAGLGPITPEYR